METINENSTQIGREITNRFFAAVYALIEKGDLASRNALANELKQPRNNFYTLECHKTRMVQLYMCNYVVSKYYIDGTWLLTGRGEMFRDDEETRDIASGELKSNRIVTNRYFDATNLLTEVRKLSSPNELFREMGYVRSTYASILSQEGKSVTPAMCYHLVEKYRINGTWLLSDIGVKTR